MFWHRNRSFEPHRFCGVALMVLMSIPLSLFASDTTAVVPSPSTVVIAPSIAWGRWDGWGVSLCWWANVFGDRDDLADLIFTTNDVVLQGRTLPGLGLNIARYNAGGCSSNQVDEGTINLSPAIPLAKQIQGHWLNTESSAPASSSWDWQADARQREMLLKAHARGANLLELFSNSPMWWLCRNHNPSGADHGQDNNLPSEQFAQHAVYLATIARYAQDHWGVTFDSVESFNEPISDWWKASGSQEGCHFDRAAQATVISDLRRELNQRGLSTVKVSASDENTYDQALATWKSFDVSTRQQVGRLNTHGYQYQNGRRDSLYAAAAGEKLWNSEYGDADASGEKLAKNLNLDFYWLHPTGWCYWQALDDGRGWGLIQANLANQTIGSINRKYFILAQYTRHIRPGMTILKSSQTNTVAAYDDSTKSLVLITANFAEEKQIDFNLSHFARVDGPVQAWITSTTTGPEYESATNFVLTAKNIRAWFPPDTVQTLVIHQVKIVRP